MAPGATVGGSSWTKEWLKFDNSYFKVLKEQDDEHLLVLETDGVLMTDPKFRLACLLAACSGTLAHT